MIQITMGVLKKDEESCDIYREFIEDFSLKLDPSKVYDIGIDQSTSCTGIAICPLDGSFICILEVLNVNFDSYYKVQLRNFLKTIFKDVSIRYLVMEEPLGYITGRRNKVLTDLKKYLDEMKNSLIVDNFTSIPVTSWRHGLMPKVVEGDRRKKDTIVKVVLDMYSGFSDLLPYLNHDYDGIEALGIIIGYKSRHGVGEVGLKIIGPKNTRKEAISFFKYCDVSSGDFNNIMSDSLKIPKEVTVGKGDVKIKTYNEEGNIYANAKMSLVDPFTFTIVTDELDVISSLIRMGQAPKPNHMLFMFTVHKKFYNDSMIRELYSEGYYPVLFQ